ncbi:MAG TPA: VWA domain-containing protein [Pirellulales bacterium]|nr:VWA domain-containing protein [Pirellulales bacterium]
MSQVCLSRSAWWASLLVLGIGVQQAESEKIFAADSKPAPKSAAAWETYAKPDGEVFFALKLSPQLAQPKTVPHDVVVLFDTSASQVGPFRAKALGAVRAMLASLGADDRVALLAVDVNAVRLTPSFTSPTGGAIQQALAALERRVPLGSTDMGQALNAALAVSIEANEAGRAKTVVYVGDGLSTARPVLVPALTKIVGQFTANRISFDSYAIGPRVANELLAALSMQTGGMVLNDDDSSDQQLGGDLASVVRSAVIWPTDTKLPGAIRDAYPRQMPPLRFDRDSVLVGTLDPAALDTQQPLSIEVQGDLWGKPVTLRWHAVPEHASPDNAYLAKVVEFAAPNDGVALPIAGSAGLDDLRRMVNFGAQQLARLGERALAVGRADEAAQLADAAEQLNPINSEANLVRTAAARRQSNAKNMRLVRAQPAEAVPPAVAENEAADGELLDEIEHQTRVVQGFLQAEVNHELNVANASMGSDPEATRDRLKLLLDKVQRTAELNPEVRAQLVDKIEASLRSANRMATLKAEQDLQRQQILAEGEARERINRALFLQEQKVDQLMSRFNALMDEERYRDAETLADIAEEIEPGRPGLRGAELTARMVGFTADMNAVRDMRYRGFVDACYQIELSHVPTSDEPPILYPDPEVWQLLTERRKKYKAVDLTQHGPNETRILAALDEKTDLDFAEQPLTDAIDYLKQRHGIEIQLDTKALTDAGVGSDTPITRTIRGITLRSALKLLLSEMDLTYVIKNEVLMITSKTEAENMLSTRVYPVADLVIPVPQTGIGGRGAFNVRDDEALETVPSEGGLRAFAVRDDLNLTKKAKGGGKANGAQGKAVPKQPAAEKANVEKGDAEPAPAAEKGAVGNQAAAAPRPRGKKFEPIRIEIKEGEDIDAAWNNYFAAHTEDKAPGEAVVRETVAQLMNARKFDHAIACMYAALRNQQGLPWMYESLSIAMQADQRTPEEIERVLLSVLDFASNPLEVMYLAQYMARSGLDKRALQLFEQVSQIWPFAPQPYIAGLQLAQKLDDQEAIEWSTLGILGQPWPNQYIHIWENGWNAAQATLERLKSENRKSEADAYKKKVDEALSRDLVVVVSWNGEADVDLLVEEPSGSVCSFRMPRTLSGGMMLGDTVSRSKKDELKAEGAQEAYACPKGFNGEYRIFVRRVWGKVTANKVTVDVFWHYWTKKERTMRKQIDLSGGEAVCVVDLQDGRRTEPLEQQQLANAVANQMALACLWYSLDQERIAIASAGTQVDVNRQLNAQTDYGAIGSMSRSRAKQVGNGPGGLNRVNPFFVRGAAGYQPVISSLPQGAQMFTTAVVSADRRYVRVTPIPIFSVVSEVNTFNFVTGQGGTSAGAGGGGFGAGGGAGGLGGFGGGKGGGAGGGL